jgi:hypothetical protein
MRVDKPWRDDQVRRINNSCSAFVDLADLGNSITGNRDISAHSGRTGAVDYRTILYQQVVSHVALSFAFRAAGFFSLD